MKIQSKQFTHDTAFAHILVSGGIDERRKLSNILQHRKIFVMITEDDNQTKYMIWHKDIKEALELVKRNVKLIRQLKERS